MTTECPQCGGTGTIRVADSGRSPYPTRYDPKWYDHDEECPTCGGCCTVDADEDEQ